MSSTEEEEGLLKFSDEGAFETYFRTVQVEGLAAPVDENGGEIGYIAGRYDRLEAVQVFKFDFSTGALSKEFGGGHISAVALDPATGELFVDKEASIDRYAPGAESAGGLLEAFPEAGLDGSHGLAVNPAGTVYATERTAGEVKVFDLDSLPQVAVGAVANLSPTSVTLQGSVNPEGAAVKSCELEYGPTTAYGQTAACEPAAGSLGEGTEPVLVSAKLSGLPSGTTYHYRFVASSAIGTNRGSDHVVMTPGPSVTAEQVSSVEAMAATLQATIDPDGGATTYHFEYDTRPYAESEGPHGTSLPMPSASVGSGTSPVSVEVRLTGLQPGETYYYRVVAEGAPLGALESFDGPGKAFTTNPGSAGGRALESCSNEQRRAEQPYGLTLPDCRAYEMVSPARNRWARRDRFVRSLGAACRGLWRSAHVRVVG